MEERTFAHLYLGEIDKQLEMIRHRTAQGFEEHSSYLKQVGVYRGLETARDTFVDMLDEYRKEEEDVNYG